MKISSIYRLLTTVLVTFFLFPLVSSAATVTGTLGVTATIGSGCQVNSGTVDDGMVDFGTLNFGSIYSLNDQHVDAQSAGINNGSIVLECTGGTSYTISLGNGENHDGTSRGMVNTLDPDELLRYALYQDSTRSLPWTPATPLTGTASGGVETFPVFGRIPGGQATVPAGVYQDTVQVVISW